MHIHVDLAKTTYMSDEKNNFDNCRFNIGALGINIYVIDIIVVMLFAIDYVQ